MTNRFPLGRSTLSSALLLAALMNAPSAQAFSINNIVPTDRLPSWSLFLGIFDDDENGPHCAAIQLTPNVSVSANPCVATNHFSALWQYYPKAPAYITAITVPYEGPDKFGDVGNLTLNLATPDVTGIAPANILSYREERSALQDGNNSLTTGTKLRVYGGTQAANYNDRQVAYTDNYFDHNNQSDGRPLIFRSIPTYRQLEPERFNPTVPNAIFDAKTLEFFAQRGLNDKQIDGMVLLTAGLQNDAGDGITSPITEQDDGSGIFYQATDGILSLVGMKSSSTVHVRLSHYWPWVYQTLRDNNLKADAISFAQRVLGTGTWGTNDRKGTLGDIFLYDNPYNGDVEFFRLTTVDSDERYRYFPTNKTNNQYWQYLGTSLPTFDEATRYAALGNWGHDDRKGTLGTVYVYNNPYNGDTEYFKLIGLGSDQRYWYFPTNKTDNQYWQYLGTSLPAR